MNHYEFLENALPMFFAKNGLDSRFAKGCASADGDKCYGYRDKWEKHGIPFEKGVAIYILSKFEPFSKEVRNTSNGWVAPDQWVVDNKDRFMDKF